MSKNMKKKIAIIAAAMALMVVFASSAMAAPAYPLPNNYPPYSNGKYINNEQTVILDNVSAKAVLIQQQAFNIVLDISPTVNPVIAPNINIQVPEIFAAKLGVQQ